MNCGYCGKHKPSFSQCDCLEEDEWENFHVVNTNDVSTFRLVSWDTPEPTIRKLMKKLRADFPHKEFRLQPHSPYGSIKWIQYRTPNFWGIKREMNFWGVCEE